MSTNPKTHEALTIARQDLIDAFERYRNSKARAHELKERTLKARQDLESARHALEHAKRAANKAFDEHLAGKLELTAIEQRHAEVSRLEQQVKLLAELEERFRQAKPIGTEEAYHALRAARDTFARQLGRASVGDFDGLRSRLLEAFAADLWGQKIQATEITSTTGLRFGDFVGDFLGLPDSTELSDAYARLIATHLVNLPEGLS